ncbi:hypothetical protein COCSUDRAFT_43073 [Coccomyxa subellipsoidea C-169]|uniref:Coenzyme Q-binding protein COQ10 START domain-containing protein n=1 Tax=Coccomyxa subellipsoidea (strain C-169) TaxID=574566 RepID=I0YSE2_COCSC|nr:hypothetical protein COCSUDRAFT_43073 [Coccomyxa subellipsoidea C-169]EIE21311.1 hypothetical protein COCSUDRAFT_43073 [Coccomyxa subellipsoidea C-169]|eukprot:XP_005645855.1 hypothetical protein COCSUDRAFT_43073 [Coccomyxa subellipsoidea C-169]
MESWSDRDAKVEVTRPEGFLMKVALQAKVDLSPDEVYDILTAPDNASVFKGIKKVPYRKVLQDDGRGKQKVEVEQLAAWKFLMFSGSFATRLYVFQDKRRHIVEFRLARPGLMKDFAGTWRVQPFTQDAVGALFKADQPQAQNPWHSLTNTLNSYLGDRKVKATLVSLEQSLEPAVRPPKALEGLVKGIAVSQLQGLLKDLREEVPRIKAGSKKQRKQVMWLETDLQDRHSWALRGGSPMGVNRRC